MSVRARIGRGSGSAGGAAGANTAEAVVIRVEWDSKREKVLATAVVLGEKGM